MNKHLRIYFAGPLFTHAERNWNRDLAMQLREQGFEVTLPQESAQEMLAGTKPFDAAALFARCTTGVDRCDLVLAVLDGPAPDSGTCWECGYPWKSGKPIIGLRKDIRVGGDDGDRPVNLMLARCCADFVVADKANTSIADLARQVHDAVMRLTKALSLPM